MISTPEQTHADWSLVQANNTALETLQVISRLDPTLGGMSAVVPRLSSELARTANIGVTICVFGDDQERRAQPLNDLVEHSHWTSSRGAWLRDGSLRERFSSVVRQADLVHIHGLWETSVTAAARTSHQVKTPYIVSAHGMLEPWALANKRLKKSLYSALVERKNLAGAACLHALTADEAADYRRYGCKQPIAVIPNGVETPSAADPSLFLKRFPELAGKSILLFLGRIHFKKGLDILIPAWASLQHQYPDAILVLAGPDSEGTQKSVDSLIEKSGLAQRVLCTGMLHEELKWSALAAATCFILPSYSEGLSVAVLEALSAGVPVIVSEQTHLPQVAERGAGYVVPTEVEPLQRAMQQMLDHSEAIHAAIGQRGREFAKEFQWKTVTEKMAQLYRWVSGGPRPTSFPIEGGRS